VTVKNRQDETLGKVADLALDVESYVGTSR
jgi:hypothetical protein